jgi:hypothetical protein
LPGPLWCLNACYISGPASACGRAQPSLLPAAANVDARTREKLVRAFYPYHPRTDKLIAQRNWCVRALAVVVGGAVGRPAWHWHIDPLAVQHDLTQHSASLCLMRCLRCGCMVDAALSARCAPHDAGAT